MRVILQRVKEAKVEIEGQIYGQIGEGLVIFVGIEEEDSQEDIDWLTHKITHLRIFNDEEGKMNRSLLDINGNALIISQFTLHAKTKKGHRPSYIHAAKPEKSLPLYEKFIHSFNQKITQEVQTGKFGAMMDVSLINHGPVTIFIDSKRRE
jgi:D-tyrosyl-tRNA(Tyr) deacylase